MESLKIIAPLPGAVVPWRQTVIVHTTPVEVPFMLYVFQNDGVWHRQPVPEFRGRLTPNQGMYEQRCYFGEEGTDVGKDYAVVAVLSHHELPPILESLLPLGTAFSNIVSVTRK